MKKQKTQQFARFYLKDIKSQFQQDINKKTILEKINLSANS